MFRYCLSISVELELDEELVEVFLDLRSQGSCRVFLLVRRQLDRHYNLGFDLYDETIGPFCHLLAPLLLKAQVAHVADDERSILARVERHLVWGAATHDERSLSPSFTSCKPSSKKA